MPGARCPRPAGQTAHQSTASVDAARGGDDVTDAALMSSPGKGAGLPGVSGGDEAGRHASVYVTFKLNFRLFDCSTLDDHVYI